MDKYINQFPEQLHEAIAMGRNIPPMPLSGISNIIITGMGGSGIGALLVKELVKNELPLPVEVNNDYALPAYADASTLVLCSSYSGNTEETLEAFEQAIQNNCRVVCITTGGKLKERATQLQKLVIGIPPGRPPRTSLGYSFTAQISLLVKADLLPYSTIDAIAAAADFLTAEKSAIQTAAKSLAKSLQNTIPVVYSGVAHAGIGLRWKQQINENSKMHAFAHVIPEMNHNELVAYDHADKNISVILLRDPSDHPQIRRRFDLCADLIRPQVNSLHIIETKGTEPITKMMYLIHLGDWVSYYLSELNQVDPIRIDILDALKKALENK